MHIEAASLYNHISSKQFILSELLLDIAHQFTEGMSKVANSDRSALSKLEDLVGLHVDLTVTNTDAISLLPNEWVHLQEPQLKEFIELREDYEQEFRKIIIDSIEEGSIKKLDPDVILFSVLSTLRWLYSWYSKYKETKDVETLKANLIQSLIYGLK